MSSEGKLPCECGGTGMVAATPGQPGDGPMPCPGCQDGFRFDVQVYGPENPDRHPGVMASYTAEGESAESVAAIESERWAWSLTATTVGVWAADRKSGHACAKVPRGGV